jgi:hypothetical protein
MTMKLTRTAALRGGLYALGLAAGGAAIGAAAFGYADFDAATGMLDIKPFNLYAITGVSVASIAGNGFALLAVLRGWKVRAGTGS